MKNEINSELMLNLIEEFIINNKNLFGPYHYVEKKPEEQPDSESEYDYDSGLTEKDQRIKKFYDELRYVHNIRDISYAELSNKIEEVKQNIDLRNKKTFERLKETDYINSFVLKNKDSITDEKIDDFIEFLKDKGFYPLDKDQIRDYINSIEVTEEEIPFKPEELKTKLDEEFREYVLKFINLIDKQRIKFGISEEKFKNMVIKVLKISETDMSQPKYDYKTKKYAMLKEIADTSDDINPFYIVKYYNIETGKVYYSIYYENGTLEYSMIESYDDAVELAKKLIKTGERSGKKSPEKRKTGVKRKTPDKKQERIKEFGSEDLEDMKLSYEDEEIISDQEFIKNTIQDIHYRQDQKLAEIGDKRFLIFKIIGWIFGFTVIFTPFAFMIFLAIRSHEALTGKGKTKSKTFLKITKVLGWVFIFSVVGLPIGIPLLILTYITENAEHKYKIEVNKGKYFGGQGERMKPAESFDQEDMDYDSFVSVEKALEDDKPEKTKKQETNKQTERIGEEDTSGDNNDNNQEEDIDYDAIIDEEDIINDNDLFKEQNSSKHQTEDETDDKYPNGHSKDDENDVSHDDEQNTEQEEDESQKD
jgi:hypothetical protein